MSPIDYLLIAIISVLSILLGYFLHQAMHAQRIRRLEVELEDQARLKDILAETKRDLQKLELDHQSLLHKQEHLKQDNYELGLDYKSLQDDLRAKEEALNTRVYEVPPQLAHIEESNVLLSSEIKRLRTRIKRLKAKSLYKENRRLKHQLRKAKVKLLKFKAKSFSKKKLVRYQHLYKRIMSVSEEIRNLRAKTEEATKRIEYNDVASSNKPKKKDANKAEKSNNKETKNKEKGKIKGRKKKDKKEIKSSLTRGKQKEEDYSGKYSISKKLQKFEESKANAQSDTIKPATTEAKGLIDLAGMDSEAFTALYEAGIRNFEDLASTRIAQVRIILENAGLSSPSYHHPTWPIQADLALKGRWDIVQDYKDRIHNQIQ